MDKMHKRFHARKRIDAQNQIFVISLGGSIIVPEEIDVKFLNEFKNIILKHIRLGKKFIIIAGGGRTARIYMNAAEKIVKLNDEDKDWLGIHATRLNAHLLLTIFKKYAYPKVIKNLNERLKFRNKIFVAAGYQPGCSTDYDAVLLAKNFSVKKIINISNIDYVYDKDPKKFKDAKLIKEISWKNFRKIVGNKWDPGLNVPFDPVASRVAQRLKMRVFIIGKELKNFNALLNGRDFKGTVIY